MIAINLINPGTLRRRRSKRRIKQWVGVFVITAGVVAVPVSFELSREHQVQVLRAERVEIAAQNEATRQMLNEQGIEIRNLEAQANRAQALRGKRSWSKLLGIVGRVLPREVWLASLNTEPARPTGSSRDMSSIPAVRPGASSSTGKDEEPRVVTMKAPRSLRIEGYALDHDNLFDYTSRLKAMQIFTDVKLKKAMEEPVFSGKAIRFNLVCNW